MFTSISAWATRRHYWSAGNVGSAPCRIEMRRPLNVWTALSAGLSWWSPRDAIWYYMFGSSISSIIYPDTLLSNRSITGLTPTFLNLSWHAFKPLINEDFFLFLSGLPIWHWRYNCTLWRCMRFIVLKLSGICLLVLSMPRFSSATPKKYSGHVLMVGVGVVGLGLLPLWLVVPPVSFSVVFPLPLHVSLVAIFVLQLPLFLARS